MYYRHFVNLIKNALTLVTSFFSFLPAASWPKTLSGYPSTAGSTCSMVIICGNDMYTAHVGDSRIVLGKSEPRGFNTSNVYGVTSHKIVTETLTVDHKPSDIEEIERIEEAGGRVQDKAGVQRVVWSRPKLDHTGPITRNTELTDIPFLAVARSLGNYSILERLRFREFAVGFTMTCEMTIHATFAH